MLLSRPIRKQATQSVILVDEFKRLYELTNFTLPSVQFWLGYISSYAYQRCPISNKIFTIDDWKQLSQTINMVMLASFDQVIKTENVYQLIIYAVCSQISIKQGGANIKKITQCIRRYLQELALDTRYLKNRFFNVTQSKTEQKVNSSEKKQKKFIQPPKKIQQSQQNIGLGIQCPICVQQITLSTVCPISCGHNLHKACFLQYFKNKVQNKKFPISCPQQGCGIEVVIQDLQEYIPKEQLQKFYEFSLHQFVDKNNKNTNWCPTPGCSAVFSYDGEVLTYKCMGCQKEYCLSCKTESHEGYTCQRNKQMLNLPEEQKEFINFAKGAHMKQCPSCKFWVEKNKGCDHMTCRCGYEFCFRCGAKYGEGQCSCDQNDSFYGNDDDSDGGDDEQINSYPPEGQEQEQDQDSYRDRLDRINPPRDFRQPIMLGRGRGRRGIQNIFDIFHRNNGVRIGGDQRREIPNSRGHYQKQQSPMQDAYKNQQMSRSSGSSFESNERKL